MTRRTFKILLYFSIFLLPVPQIAMGQVTGDSTTIDLDSIQDARMDRMEWQTGRQVNRLNEGQARQDAALDSADQVLDALREKVSRLDRDRESQSEQLRQLEEELARTSEASRMYQEKLRNAVWISGTFLLLLLIASFLVLFVYGLKTRHLMERFRDKLKRLGRELRGELKSQKKTLRSEIKSVNKATRRKSMKAITDSIKGLKVKKLKKS